MIYLHIRTKKVTRSIVEQLKLTKHGFNSMILSGIRLRFGFNRISKEYIGNDDWRDLFDPNNKIQRNPMMINGDGLEMNVIQPPTRFLKFEEEKDKLIILYHKLISALNRKRISYKVDRCEKQIYHIYLRMLASLLPLNITQYINNYINNIYYKHQEEIDKKYTFSGDGAKNIPNIQNALDFILQCYINNLFPSCYCTEKCTCRFSLYKNKLIRFINKIFGRNIKYKNLNSFYFEGMNNLGTKGFNDVHGSDPNLKHMHLHLSHIFEQNSHTISERSFSRRNSMECEDELNNLNDFSTISYKYFTQTGQVFIHNLIKILETFKIAVIDCYSFDGVRDIINNVCNIENLNAIYVNSYNPVHFYDKISKFIEYITYQRTVKSKIIKKSSRRKEKKRNSNHTGVLTMQNSFEEGVSSDSEDDGILFLDQENYDELDFMISDMVYHGANSSKDKRPQKREKHVNINPIDNSILIIDATNLPSEYDINFIPILSSLINQDEPYINVRGGHYVVSLVKQIIFLRNASINPIKVDLRGKEEDIRDNLLKNYNNNSIMFFYRFPHLQIFNCPVKSGTVVDIALNNAYLVNEDKQRQIESINLKKFISMGIKKLLYHHFGNLANNVIQEKRDRSTSLIGQISKISSNSEKFEGENDMEYTSNNEKQNNFRVSQQRKTQSREIQCLCCNYNKRDEYIDVTNIDETYSYNNNHITHLITIIKLIMSYVFVLAEQLGVCKIKIVNKQQNLNKNYEKLNVDINYHKNRVCENLSKNQENKSDNKRNVDSVRNEKINSNVDNIIDNGVTEFINIKQSGNVIDDKEGDRQNQLMGSERYEYKDSSSTFSRQIPVVDKETKRMDTFNKRLELSTKIQPIQIIGACDYNKYIKETSELQGKKRKKNTIYEYLDTEIISDPAINYSQSSVISEREPVINIYMGSTSIIPVVEQIKVSYKILPRFFSRKLWVAAFYNASVVLYHLENYLNSNHRSNEKDDTELFEKLYEINHKNDLLRYIFRPGARKIIIPPPISIFYINEVFYLDKSRCFGVGGSRSFSFVNYPAETKNNVKDDAKGDTEKNLFPKKLTMIEEENLNNTNEQNSNNNKDEKNTPSNHILGSESSKEYKNNVYYGIINVEKYFDPGEIRGIDYMSQSYYLPMIKNTYADAVLDQCASAKEIYIGKNNIGLDTTGAGTVITTMTTSIISDNSITDTVEEFSNESLQNDTLLDEKYKKLDYYYYLSVENKLSKPQKRLLIKEKMTPNLTCSISPFRNINAKHRKYLTSNKTEFLTKDKRYSSSSNTSNITSLSTLDNDRDILLEHNIPQSSEKDIHTYYSHDIFNPEMDKPILSSGSIHTLTLLFIGMMFSNSQYILMDDNQNRLGVIIGIVSIYLKGSSFKIHYLNENSEKNSSEFSSANKYSTSPENKVLRTRQNTILDKSAEKDNKAVGTSIKSQAHKQQTQPSTPNLEKNKDKEEEPDKSSNTPRDEEDVKFGEDIISFKTDKRKYTVTMLRKNSTSQDTFSPGGKQTWSIYNDLLVLVNEVWNIKYSNLHNDDAHHWLNALFSVRDGNSCVFHRFSSNNGGWTFFNEICNVLPFPCIDLGYFDTDLAVKIQRLFKFFDAKFKKDIKKRESVVDALNRLSSYAGIFSMNSSESNNLDYPLSPISNITNSVGGKKINKKYAVNQLNTYNLIRQHLMKISNPTYRMNKLILDSSLILSNAQSFVESKISYSKKSHADLLDFSDIKFYKINTNIINWYLYNTDPDVKLLTLIKKVFRIY